MIGYPDFHQGFGRIDLSTVLPHATAPKTRKLLFDDIRNGSSEALAAKADASSPFAPLNRYGVKVSANPTDPLRIVLAWTDVPGKFLHNNLQLYVEGPAGLATIGNSELTFHRDPWAGDSLARAAAPAGVQLGGVDFDKYNNVEQVIINAPIGGNYRISVIAQYTDPDEKAQGYALCVSGELDSPTLARA
jgi:serine protease AprX